VAADWWKLCRSEGLALAGDAVVVDLADGRRHSVKVRDTGDTFSLTAIVAKPALLQQVPQVPLLAWRRNRASRLVGFRVDPTGRLVGESWVPKVGLTAEEFQLYVRRVAVECDRLEHLLTGTDQD